jgi:nucleotide-binding universal stress UspA family protein
MYRKILVPLDGSELAECALGHVRNLIKERFASEVTLISIVRVDLGWGTDVDVNTIRNKLFVASNSYLADVETRLHSEGFTVKTKALESNRTAHAITDYAHKNGMDLIVMATHGYTGLKKMMLGSVALGVLHDSHIPVLLIRPESSQV